MPTVKKQFPKGTKTKRPTRKKTGGVMDRIQNLGEADLDYVKMNIYGRSGTGKTTLYSTFPGRILTLLCSGVVNTGELKSVAVKDRKKIDSIVIEDSSEIAEILTDPSITRDYETVVTDHATGVNDLHLKEILGLDELPVQKNWGMATREQYSQAGIKTKEVLRTMLQLEGVNVVIIAQERAHDNNEDRQGGDLDLIPFVADDLTKSVVAFLLPACDYTVQTFIRKKTKIIEKKVAGKTKKMRVEAEGECEYCIRTGPHPIFHTKFRVPRGTKLPPDIVDPTYDKIMALIRGEE